MRTLALALTLLLLSPGLAIPAQAQGATDILFTFDLHLENDGRVEMPDTGAASSVYIRGNFTDRSNEGYGGVVGLTHTVAFTATPVIPMEGWSIGGIEPAPVTTTRAGETAPFQVQVSALPSATSAFFYVNVSVSVTDEFQGQTSIWHNARVYFQGKATFGLNYAGGMLNVAPRDYANTTFLIRNDYIEPHAFSIRSGENPCGFIVVAPQQVMVAGRGQAEVRIDLVTPADKVVYLFGDMCQVELTVQDVERPASARSFRVNATITGVGADFPFFFNLIVLLLLLVLLILFIRRRKERLEEQILGKPQKPWLIPVEKVYLTHLKRKDPRAWYVVRHFVMEDEYRSSLLWFKSYKAATKGDRKKERLILKEERSYAKWQAKWAKSIAQPALAADRFEAKLQTKLDRKAKRRLRRERRKWRKEAKSLGATHRKAVERAGERHEKAVKRAARKGLPEPALATVTETAAPPEPTLRHVRLADHRWAKKAARHRARMARKQGNLEVRFERADARYLESLRRRVQRIGRKLDDPTFLAEHPMLNDGTAKASGRARKAA